MRDHKKKSRWGRYTAIAIRHPGMLRAWVEKRLRGLATLDVVYLECTGICNLECRVCFSRTTPEPLGSMSRETFHAVAKRLFPFAYSVNFVGYGEPLLHELLPWMIRTVKSYGREAHVTTNGLLLDEGKICQLIGAGTDSIAVSLDGATGASHDWNRGKGSFAKTVRNIEILQKVKGAMRRTRPHLVIDVVVHARNRDEITDLLELAGRLGASTVNLGHLQARTEEEAKLRLDREQDGLERQYDVWRAGARARGIGLCLPEELGGGDGRGCFWDPRRRLAVSWDGRVRPCCFLYHSNRWYYRGGSISVQAPSFGNLADRSFAAVWKGEAYREFRAKVSRGGPLPPECAPCTLRSRER